MALLRNYTVSEKFLWNLYIADIPRTTFKEIEDVPILTAQMVPIFIFLMILEDVILYGRGMQLIRLNQGISSILIAMMTALTGYLISGLEFYGYFWLYEYRLITLDWASPWTWWTAAIGVDFCAYWFHRMMHEVNFLWSFIHQTHHSAEDFNITAAVRQFSLQKLYFSGFCIPLALLGVPLAAVAVHFQFNVIFQVWIHTEVVPSLGLLEWIFATPTNHQVHHGSNNWCLDKNYGFVLIIWDRIFGTYQEKLKDDDIIYGLVSETESFEPFYIQFSYSIKMVKNALAMDSLTNFLKSIFYGPSWIPGEDRLGAILDMTKKTEQREKYDPKLSHFMTFYTMLHFGILTVIYLHLYINAKVFDTWNLCIFVAFAAISAYSIGNMLDGKFEWVAKIDLFRCMYGVYFVWKFLNTGFIFVDIAAILCFAASSIFWMYQHTIKLKDA